MYEWDEAKRAATLAKHGIDFAAIGQFDWLTAQTREDGRSDYSERRYISYGQIGGRLFCCAWTPRGANVRIVMLRKADKRERIGYEQEKKLHWEG